MDIRLRTPPVPTWTLRPSFRMSAKVKLALGVRLSGGRGRDEDFSSPPAQIPTNAAKKAVARGASPYVSVLQCHSLAGYRETRALAANLMHSAAHWR